MTKPQAFGYYDEVFAVRGLLEVARGISKAREQQIHKQDQALKEAKRILGRLVSPRNAIDAMWAKHDAKRWLEASEIGRQKK